MTLSLRLPLRIGTRGSPLALAQAHQVAARLRAAHGLDADAVAIVAIKTTGDAIQDRTLREAGGKGLFTKEIEEALIAGTVDVAVHSMKDVETRLPAGLTIDCLLPRADVRDAFISARSPTLAALPAGAVVGTASLRRQAQVLRLRPDLTVVPFRGNVQTRLAKLAAGDVDATLLAMAGLERLGQVSVATAPMAVTQMLPAVAQGAIGVQRRTDDVAMAAVLAPLHDAATGIAVSAERAFLARLDGSCRTPIAGHAVLDGGTLRLTGQILTLDGREAHEGMVAGPEAHAGDLGQALGEQLLAAAGSNFLTRS